MFVFQPQQADMGLRQRSLTSYRKPSSGITSTLLSSKQLMEQCLALLCGMWPLASLLLGQDGGGLGWEDTVDSPRFLACLQLAGRTAFSL